MVRVGVRVRAMVRGGLQLRMMRSIAPEEFGQDSEREARVSCTQEEGGGGGLEWNDPML